MSFRSKILVVLSGVAMACAVVVATPSATSQASAAPIGFGIDPNFIHHYSNS